MSASDLLGTLMPDGRVDFEHGVENHPDFDQLAEDCYGVLTRDVDRMSRLWCRWIADGMPGLGDLLRDEVPGVDAIDCRPVQRERVQREMGGYVRRAFDAVVCRAADEEAAELLSSPAAMARWVDARAEAQWEERTGARAGAA